MTSEIDWDALEVGRLYRLRSRNLIAGVWNGLDFVGLRDKFGIILDAAETRQTVREVEPTEHVVPRHIGLQLGHSRCATCHRPTTYSADRDPRWQHAELLGAIDESADDTAHPARPASFTNWELWIWLDEHGANPRRKS
jgi:mono/diheme cytochrome c family protein